MSTGSEAEIATSTTTDPRINDRIRAREVRLVDPDGEQLGIKLLPEALAIARDLDLDLVEVAPGANPPVCRIMDFGKHKFDEAQRAKESKRKAVHVGIKEMKYRPKIGPGDFDTKTRQVAKFLEEGHKVKITIMFRGREVFHPELGKKILDRIADQMDGLGKSESIPRLDGRNMVMVLAPEKRSKPAGSSRSGGSKGEHRGSGEPASVTTPEAHAGESTQTEATAPAAPATPGPAGGQPAPATGAPTPVVAAAAPEPEAAPATTAGDAPPAADSSEGEG
ncbi:MAG: translation initiation factor IF-3 [Acidimicrobiales bacterium]|jgi:translation initiation factor IF-3